MTGSTARLGKNFVVIAAPGLNPGVHPAIQPLRNAAMRGHCYLLASKKRGTLYWGTTSDLPSRIWEHREGLVEGFTSRYGVKRLVWYEEFPWLIDAIKREKAINPRI